jgi:hypothetical protein
MGRGECSSTGLSNAAACSLSRLLNFSFAVSSISAYSSTISSPSDEVSVKIFFRRCYFFVHHFLLREIKIQPGLHWKNGALLFEQRFISFITLQEKLFRQEVLHGTEVRKLILLIAEDL